MARIDLGAAVERIPIGEVGKSGASVERVLMPDGQRLVVKRVAPADDFFMQLIGADSSHELRLWSAGILDQLPHPAAHAVVDGWREDGVDVLVMNDLGSAVLTWEDRLTRAQCRRILTAISGVHRRFHDNAPADLTPLDRHLAVFAPDQMAAPASQGNPLALACVRGWDIFADRVEPRVADAVMGLLTEPEPLVAALERRTSTLVHGDLATVNLALEADRVVLVDWAMPARAPAALDVSRFIAGCASVVDASREAMLADYREVAGATYDDDAMRLALLSGLVWLGWNKAFDAVDNPDPVIREREQADLDWWVGQARIALESEVW